MQLNNILYPATTVSGAQVDSKKGVLELISKLIAQHLGNISYEEILDCLATREKLGSTSIGHGVALPHGRSKLITAPIGALIRTNKKIDFDAIDNQSIDLFFGLLVPEEEEKHHLEIIAALANKFSHEDFRAKLRRAKNNKELYQLATSD